MKISQLQTELAKVSAQFGDIEVMLDYDGMIERAEAVYTDKLDGVNEVVFIDIEERG